MRKCEYEKLNYLIALAKIGHFGRAAEACHIFQTDFSSAIQNLEEELGVTLVLRGQRFMGLSPAGERILQRAQPLAADWESLMQEAATSAGQLSGICVLPLHRQIRSGQAASNAYSPTANGGPGRSLIRLVYKSVSTL
ncbi:LysR family transcriptional regulator [Methylicorpusculum sp.]|uniref:LysR family transcriptional regulator n=1 Tax=Methylicorpusculum sp. TaxID=2713644 RepID=UPI00271766DF|nr:LysR family transcriptional regulator [Methylicorpusculum sp.]MDO8845652.1 LysR family transcriptional regulator [Methylicorpusculum sp.]